MNSEFDVLAKGLAQSTTRRQAIKKFSVGLAGMAFLALSATTASAQTPVPLIPISTNKAVVSVGGAGRFKSFGALEDDAATGLVIKDSSQITYPAVQPGTTLLAPAGPDVQVNDPSVDNIQTLTTWKWPFEFATDSETTLATDGGSNIVVSYNHDRMLVVKDAGNQNAGPFYFAYRYLSAYSVSHDGGQSWRSSYMTPPPGSISTGGDGVVATERAGNFYYASFGQDSNFNRGPMVAKSTDHGDTFAPAVMVALDPGVDKEWMAIGPDPSVPSRDNIYITWDSFSADGNSSAIAFSRSTDGGITWSSARIIFSYTNDGVFSSFALVSNPTVDKSNGRLYVPFIHQDHTNGDTDFFGGPDYVRVLISDDGGNTFTPLAFNVPGAPNPFVYPNFVQGTPADCGAEGGERWVIKQGSDIGGGLWGELVGLPRFVHCTRMNEQPATAAQNGRVIIALNASINDVGVDPSSPSQIIAIYSKDAGRTWFPPFVLAPATTTDPRHFLPAVALAHNAGILYVGYYVQQSDEKVRTELATLQVTGGGLQLLSRQPLSSVSFDLPPSNIPSPIPPLKAEDTVNFDQLIVPGYALGEYMGVTVDANGKPMAAWGDGRNTWVSPSNGMYPGPHPKADVFFVKP